MNKWEYKTIKIDSKTSWMGGKFDYSKVDEHLETLGETGWELVNVISLNKGYGATEGLVMFFKKPRD